MKIVEVKLDKVRKIKYGVRAFPTIEKALGMPMEKIDFEMQETIYAMLLGGLIFNNPKLTLEKVYDIVDKAVENEMEESNLNFMDAFGKVMERLSTAIGEAMGTTTPSEE